MARYLEYLKTENRILPDKLPARVPVTPRERRRLKKYGLPLGSAINELITIVSPRTFARWAAGQKRSARTPTRKPGRARTTDPTRDLVLRMARENCWGYTRILGELRKLGLHSVSRTSVINILKAEGLDPGPQRQNHRNRRSRSGMPAVLKLVLDAATLSEC